MRAQAIDAPHLAAHVVPAIVYPHPLLAALQTPAERVERRPAGEDDQIIGPLHALSQVMQNPAELAGRARSDNHARTLIAIDLFAVLGGAGKHNARLAKQILVADRLA